MDRVKKVRPSVALVRKWLRLEREGKAELTITLHLGRIRHRRSRKR